MTIQPIWLSAQALALVVAVGVFCFWLRANWASTCHRIWTRVLGSRKGLALLQALALLLALIICWLWISSMSWVSCTRPYQIADFTINGRNILGMLQLVQRDNLADGSQIGFGESEGELSPGERWDTAFQASNIPIVRRIGWAGFYYLYGDVSGYGTHYRVFSVPYWAFLLVLTIPFLLRYRYYRKLSYRQKNNLCANCGYDLRASPDRCPECGTVIHKLDQLPA